MAETKAEEAGEPGTRPLPIPVVTVPHGSQPLVPQPPRPQPPGSQPPAYNTVAGPDAPVPVLQWGPPHGAQTWGIPGSSGAPVQVIPGNWGPSAAQGAQLPAGQYAAANVQYAPAAQIVVVQPGATGPLAMSASRYPVRTQCPHCLVDVTTETSRETGQSTWVWCLVLCCVGLIVLAWLPWVVDSCKEVVHKCPQCKRKLGRCTGSGDSSGKNQ